jgi:acyl-CoA thioesterase
LPDLYRAARRGGFHQNVGFRVIVAQSGRGFCTVAGKVLRRHLNINGVVHGGVYATILDTAMGAGGGGFLPEGEKTPTPPLSVLTEDETTATTSLYVEFLSAAREGHTLIARGRVLRRGRHIAFAEGDLVGDDGRRLSQAHGTWYIWSSSEAPRTHPRPPARPARAPR